MGLLDRYLNIKNKVKLNDAIMDGVAKAISQRLLLILRGGCG
mgnify:CR=1 FL=1